MEHLDPDFPRRAYPVTVVRDLEARAIAAAGGDTLMAQAAEGLASICIRELNARAGGVYGRSVLVAVGPGNNGGDALFAAARLARRGGRVTAIRCLGEPHAAGLAALQTAGGRLIDLGEVGIDPRGQQTPAMIENAGLILDGVLGIGGRPGLPGDVVEFARHCERADAGVVAVDLPSGVDPDTGGAADAFSADVTVVFGVLKPCHLLQPARARCGRVEIVDIGLPRAGEGIPSLKQFARLWTGWPYPDETSDKYSRGVVGIDTGSAAYPGAGLMSTYGAVFSGAGMVRFLGADRSADLVRQQLPNVVFAPGRVQSYLLGSGWGDRPDGREVIHRALDSGVPAVVDADGLNYLPDRLPPDWLLTPHAGELARLLDTDRTAVSDDPVRAVREAADRLGATVLLKGASQLVAEPHRPMVSVAVGGPAWTAQAGSGDVLGGICATVLAAGLGAASAALFGASLQAQTARRNPGPLPPIELARRFPAEIARLQRTWRRP